MNIKQFAISLGTIAVKLVVAYMILSRVILWTSNAYDFGFRVFTEEPISTVGPGITYSVTITEGTTGRELGEVLKQKGLVRDDNLFFIQYMLSEYKDKLVPGVYELSTSMTADEMLAVMGADYVGEEEEESGENDS